MEEAAEELKEGSPSGLIYNHDDMMDFAIWYSNASGDKSVAAELYKWSYANKRN